MAFEGRLETMPVADLLQWAAIGRQTGTIRISGGDVTKMIYIRKGMIVSCTSTDPRELLGHFLVSRGAISESVLQAAVLEQERSKGLLGQILVERAAIAVEELERMLRLKAEEAIFDLFTWTEGRFLFLDGALPGYELVPISLDVQQLVLEGTRRLDEWRRIRKVIPSGLCVPVAVRPLVVDGDPADPGHRSVLESVDDDRSIEDICLHTHSSEFYVCEILVREVRQDRLKIVRPRTLPGNFAAAEDATGESLLLAARERLAADDPERALRNLRAAASLEPHDRQLRGRIAELEAELRDLLVDAGVRPDAVPRLRAGFEDLADLKLEPDEGFILSRVDDHSTVEAIVKISPLPEIEAMLVLWKLLRGGQIGVS